MAPDGKSITYKSSWHNKGTYLKAQKRLDEMFQKTYGFTEDEFYLILGYEISVDEKNL